MSGIIAASSTISFAFRGVSCIETHRNHVIQVVSGEYLKNLKIFWISSNKYDNNFCDQTKILEDPIPVTFFLIQMSASRKIQIVLLASLLWSSTSLSSFSAHATTPKTNESVTVKIPDNLIAGELRDMMSRIPMVSNMFSQFDQIWKNPTDRKQRLFDYCNTTQKEVKPDQCFKFLSLWITDQIDSGNDNDFEQLMNIDDEVMNIIRKS